MRGCGQKHTAVRAPATPSCSQHSTYCCSTAGPLLRASKLLCWGLTCAHTCSAKLLTSMLCARQAMTADDQQKIGATTWASCNLSSLQPSALLSTSVVGDPTQHYADIAAMEALRQLQLAPTPLHAADQTEGLSLRHAVTADPGDCTSPLSPEAVAKLCCDDEESQEQQQRQEVGSPQSVLGLLHDSRASSGSGNDGRLRSRRTLPASGLGCGIFGASAVWGI